MFARKSLFKSLLVASLLSSLAWGGLQTVVKAQGTPGLVLFGNRDVDILSYFLDFGGIADSRDRYRLRIPKKKLAKGATQFVISYPDYFDGKFDTDRIEVRPNGKKDQALALQDVVWDQENRFLKIVLAEPLQNPKKVELVFSNVKNPDVGTYYFYAQVVPAFDAPIPQRVGAWVVSINP